MQSSHLHELRLLDRRHLFGDVVQAVSWARAAGFDNLNLDLIFAIPHQTMAMWQATLNRVLALGPEHISCYALTLEHGTPMRAWVYRGLLPMPDPNLAADMYEWASETLERHGYGQYEISNWARVEVGSQKSEIRDPDLRPLTSDLRPLTSDLRPLTSDLQYACRHNLQYWRNEPYLGFGAGAHGFVPASVLGGDCGYRYSDVLAPSAYIARMGRDEARPFPFSPALAQSTPITADEEMGERMLMGLRLVREGVTNADFERRFGVGLGERYAKEIREMRAKGLLEWDGERARLTKAGRLLGNVVFQEFV